MKMYLSKGEWQHTSEITGNQISKTTTEAVEELKEQNSNLMAALVKLQKTYLIEKRKFDEILTGIDKALSSLPIRLERIRVRNQRNLSIINSSKFNPEDGVYRYSLGDVESDMTQSEASITSFESNFYLSTRMKCLLKKMEQLNVLVNNIKEGDTSPIELLVNSELCAISLLKKEIKSTKKQMDDKTDTETNTSCNESNKEPSKESYPTNSKNSVSNELVKASNFKIFENHMILQEEALKLLTKKIKETEEALKKETETNENLKKKNEALTKELASLKVADKKYFKLEKLKAEYDLTENRPYKILKELREKLEEKEKTVFALKSKCARQEAANANKTSMLEMEKKKNAELAATVKNLKIQIKSMTAQKESLEFVNKQLMEQSETLKSQMKILSQGKLSEEISLNLKNSEIVQQISELKDILTSQESNTRKVEKEAENKVNELKALYKREINDLRMKMKGMENQNEEYLKTFKELLNLINNFGVNKEVKSARDRSMVRIKEILRLSNSELELLYDAHPKLLNSQASGHLFEECKSIVENCPSFSVSLSTWLFDVIMEKFLNLCKSDQSEHNVLK